MFCFRHLNNVKLKKQLITDTYVNVIILRKSFSLIGSDFPGKFKFKIEKVKYLSSYSLFYTTFNLELKIRAFFSFRLSANNFKSIVLQYLFRQTPLFSLKMKVSYFVFL